MRADLSQPLDGVKLIAMMVDGIGVGDHTIVVALGVTPDGAKIPLGLWQGSTENSTICTELLQNLISRGLKVEDSLLCVIDGGAKGSARRCEMSSAISPSSSAARSIIRGAPLSGAPGKCCGWSRTRAAVDSG